MNEAHGRRARTFVAPWLGRLAAFAREFSLQVFCAEYPIFSREQQAGLYRVSVYLASRSLAELPLFVALPAVFTVPTYLLIGLERSAGQFFVALAVNVLVANAACSFGEGTSVDRIE